MIVVHQLSKTYDKRAAVDNVSFSLGRNRCIALLGPNGAGKTTTLRMIAGLITPSRGEITIAGKKAKDIRPFIGYLPQHPHFHSWMTGMEFLVYAGRLAHLSKKEAQARGEALLERVGISDVKNRRIGKYSGGMKQRLGIAQALIHKPDVLMLDEPVSALDPIGRRDILTLMEELKKETTILYSTHILSDAEEMSDEILLMNRGTIVESGPLDEVKSRHQAEGISLSFTEDLPMYEEKLASMTGISSTRIQKGAILIEVESLSQARRQILERAHMEQWPISHFEIGKTTLEDLFIKVVNTDAMDNPIHKRTSRSRS